MSHAALEGDEVAQRILRESGQLLSLLGAGRAASARDGGQAVQVAATGSVLEQDAVVRQAFAEALRAAAPQVQIIAPRHEPAIGAALLAQRAYASQRERQEERMRRIRITAGNVSAFADLLDTPTAAAIWDALPIQARASTWGEEIYFRIPVHLPEQDAQEVVQLGDLGYWPPGDALCIFFGPTPMSHGKEIRPASPVNVWAQITGDTKVFKQVRSGAQVTVERADRNSRERSVECTSNWLMVKKGWLSTCRSRGQDHHHRATFRARPARRGRRASGGDAKPHRHPTAARADLARPEHRHRF